MDRAWRRGNHNTGQGARGQEHGVWCMGPGRGTGCAGRGLRGWGMHEDGDAGMRTRRDKDTGRGVARDME